MWRLVMVLGLMLILSTTTAQTTRELQPDGTLRRIHVPILMYHYVSELPDDADVYREDLTVLPEMFLSHMAYLREAGYQTITPDDLYAALMAGQPLPARPIILTFDDGYSDHYEMVFPVLQEFGFVGVFFVITGMADQANPNHLTWVQIQAMADAGMVMQSHTKTHPDLRARDYDFLVYEILGSVESLEAHTNRPVRTLSYPAGRYDAMTLTVTRQSPVVMAMTTQHGAHHTTDGRYELRRLRVSGDTGVVGLAQLLGDN